MKTNNTKKKPTTKSHWVCRYLFVQAALTIIRNSPGNSPDISRKHQQVGKKINQQWKDQINRIHLIMQAVLTIIRNSPGNYPDISRKQQWVGQKINELWKDQMNRIIVVIVIVMLQCILSVQANRCFKKQCFYPWTLTNPRLCYQEQCFLVKHI